MIDTDRSVIGHNETVMDWLSIGEGLVMDSHGQRYIGVRLSIDGDGLVMDW